MKLRGLLKGLCIFGLTLLPISFSSAGQVSQDFNIPDTKIINGSTILLLNNVNFSSTYNSQLMNHVFYIMTTTSANGRNKNAYFFAWYDGKPYLYNAYIFDGNVNSSFQGFPTKICVINAGSGSSCSNFDTDVDVFLNAGGFDHGFVSYGNGVSSYDYFKICFGNSLFDYCFQSNPYSWSDNSSQLSGSLNVLSYRPDDILRINWSSSSISNTLPPIPDSDIIYIWDGITGTNKEYIEAFEERGYYKGLCYSDFYTGNLIDSSTQISDLFIGDLDDSVYYGHSVFDFYESENTDLSTHSRSQSRYALTKYTYERDNLAPYIGKEKGTRNIMFNIYNNHFNDNFSWIDYRTYCDMIVNGYNPGDVFDGDVSQGMKDYVKRLEEEKSFILSGADVDFSGSKDLLGIFNGLYSRFKNAFPVDPDLSNKTNGLLPSYVILGFFLFLLLYVLKR